MYVVSEKWTRERRRQLTRAALVDAAAEVFAKRGFNGASLDEIAETAGFTRGAIYKNFEGKEDLFFAVRDHFNERTLQAFAQLLQQGTPADFDLSSLAALWQQVMVDQDPNVLVLNLEFRLFEIRNPSIQACSVAQRRRNREMVAQFVEDNAAKTGLILKIPSDTLAGIMLAASDGFAQAAHHNPEDAKLYETFLELITPAVVADDPQAHRRPPVDVDDS
jgi:AcrR family transcriptional regulator